MRTVHIKLATDVLGRSRMIHRRVILHFHRFLCRSDHVLIAYIQQRYGYVKMSTCHVLRWPTCDIPEKVEHRLLEFAHHRCL